MKEWVTVAEAAVLTGKSRRAIYEWIEDDKLAARIIDGKLHVLSKAALRVAPTIKRGRPRGVPTRKVG